MSANPMQSCSPGGPHEGGLVITSWWQRSHSLSWQVANGDLGVGYYSEPSGWQIVFIFSQQ